MRVVFGVFKEAVQQLSERVLAGVAPARLVLFVVLLAEERLGTGVGVLVPVVGGAGAADLAELAQLLAGEDLRAEGVAARAEAGTVVIVTGLPVMGTAAVRAVQRPLVLRPGGILTRRGGFTLAADE